MLLLVLGLFATVFLFYYFIVKPYYYWTDRGVYQGKPVLLLGDNWKLSLKKESFSEMIEAAYNQFQGVRYSGVYQFLRPILMLKDPDLLKQITVKDFDHFTDHTAFIPVDADPLWGRNLFFLKGQRWREMRSILSPSFTSSKMRVMFTLISECAGNFVDHFNKMNQDIVTIEFKDTFSRFTNDVIASTAFGLKVDSLGEPNNPFYLMGKESTDFSGVWKNLKLFGYLLAPKLFQWSKISPFSSEVSEFFQGIISDTIKMRKEKGIVRPDMINLLLDARSDIDEQKEDDVMDTGFSTAQESDFANGPGKSKQPKALTNLDITAQAMVFFIAGFDSVSGLICFLAYELAVNKDIQDRLRDEVKSTLKECEGKLTYEGLLKMKYMDMVVSETLRKWPVSVSVDRVCTKPYTILPATSSEKPLQLEKGSTLWLPIYGMHRDPKHYPDPERFDPERFSDQNKSNIKPYTYFPFGLGPRNCIGSRFALLEAKTVIFYILNNFELVPVKKSVIPVKISKQQFNLNAEGGFWFGLRRIKAVF